MMSRSPRGRAGLRALATAALLSALAPAATPGQETPLPADALSCRAGASAAALRWTDAAPARDRPALERWCAAVGAPVLEPAPAAVSNEETTTAERAMARPSTAAHSAADDALVVVSWNVHVGGGDVRRLVTDLRAGRLTGGRPVHRFVLLLQEAYRAGAALPPVRRGLPIPARIAPVPPGGVREDIVSAAAALGLSLLYVPSMRNGPGDEDRGNAVLATMPLEDPGAIVLPLEVQRRVAAAASIELGAPGGRRVRLRVVAAHLDHRAPWRRFLASFGAARLQQARALADALDGISPIVVGGDLNTWSASALERSVPYLRARFPSSPPEQPEPTYLAAGFGRRLDHVFARLRPGREPRVRRVPDRYGSDHFPLLLRIPLG